MEKHRTGQMLHLISQWDLSSGQQPLPPNEDPQAITRQAFEEEIIAKTLSSGQEVSKGKKASPILKMDRTEIMYSTDCGIYTPIIFGLYIFITIVGSPFDAENDEDVNVSVRSPLDFSPATIPKFSIAIAIS